MNVNPPKKILIQGFFNINENKILKKKWETYYETVSKKKSKPGTREYANKKKIEQFEKDFVNKNMQRIINARGTCKAIIKDRYNLDLENLLSKSNKQFFDIKLMEMLACISNLSINIDSPYKNPNNPNLKMFWGNLKRISGGAFGDAFVTTPNQQLDEAFVIKYIRPLIEYNYETGEKGVFSDVLAETVHEMFIAKILNNYRNIVPNFMYGYGYFSCSDPINTDKRDIKSICSLAGKSYYSVYERISPGTTMHAYTRNGAGLSEVLDKYLQILFALSVVSNINYTHYDLHTQNVIMRDLPLKNAVIPYINPVTGRTIYLKTDYIATIIDFGYSYLELRKVGYGMGGAEHASTYPDRSNKIMDSFKFFMFIMQDLYNDHKGVLNQLRPIFQFFDPKNSVEDYLFEREKDKYYVYDIPRSTKTSKYRHSDLIKYIINNYSEVLKDKVLFDKIPDGSVLLKCGVNGIKCVSPEDLLKKNTLKNPEKNVYKFFGLMNSQNRSDQIARSYNLVFNKILEDGVETVEKLNAQADLLLKKIETSFGSVKTKLWTILSFFSRKDTPMTIFRRIAGNLLDFDIVVGVLSELSVQIDSLNYFILYYEKGPADIWTKTNLTVNDTMLRYKKIQTYIKVFYDENKIMIGREYAITIDREKFREDYKKLRRMYDISTTKFTRLYDKFGEGALKRGVY